MKRILLILTIVFCNINLYAQNDSKDIDPEHFIDAFEEAFQELGKGVYIQVDTLLYPQQLGGVYLSNKNRATLMSKVKDGDIKKLEKTLPKSQKKGKIQHIDNGYLTHKDREILYYIGYRVDSEGVKMRVDTYVFQATPTTLVYIIGTYVDKHNVYENATIKAAFTAKYIEVKK